MMNIKSAVAMSATLAVVAMGTFSYAQDDLDDLLKDLEKETAKPAEKAAAEAKPVAEEKPAAPAAEEKAAEAPKPEVKAEAAEEKPAVEEAKPVAEEAKPVAEEVKPVAEEKVAEEKPAETAQKAEGAVKLVDNLAAEVKEPAKAAAPVDPDAELLENIRTTELVRRQALDDQAQREIKEARDCMSDQEYGEAVRHYGLALKMMNDSAATKKFRKECQQGIAEGLYRAGLQEDELGRRDRAVKLLEKALDMRHPKARRVLEKWNDEGEARAAKTDISDIKHRNNDEDYQQQRDKIRRHLRRGRQLLSVRDLTKALEEVETVLVLDPYNQEAIRLRKSIQKKRQTILQQERVAARDGMIADVDQAWRPVYAVNAAQLSETSAETVKAQLGDDPERTQEQDIERRMKEMRLPTISFKPPATIIDAVEFFRGASKDYDRPDIPVEKRGFNFVLKTPQGALKAQQAAGNGEESEGFGAAEGEGGGTGNGLDPIPTITASDITFYEALKLVCDSVDYKFIVRGPVVMVMQKDMSTAEILSRKYNVPEAFMERVNNASAEMKEIGGFGGSSAKKNDEAEESQDKDWKAFFEEMGVKWPEGSSIKHIKSLGKLYVRNTRENLAEFEKVLDELGGQPQLIEVEARFVEVSQEDLNSLGFEWILNSDYSMNLGRSLGKALGVRNGDWGSQTLYSSSDSKSDSKYATASEMHTVDAQRRDWDSKNNKYGSWGVDRDASRYNRFTQVDSAQNYLENASTSYSSKRYGQGSKGESWSNFGDGDRALGVNAFGGTSGYANGSRYLSTSGNHISGESKSTNDQFMRVNAFLGSADLSMILHMLSQRSDTDLLSAPKIVTKSGEQAVIKVVTEYIYPQDYDVQLQSSSSSGGGGTSGGSSSAILAVVEPQNFTTKEVGVVLDVLPTYSEANGGTIDLELKPTIIDEPTWKNYGMKIPFTGNPSTGVPSLAWVTGLGEDVSRSLTSAVTALIDGNSDEIASQYVSAGIESMNPNTITYYDAPMEQPFFPVRSIESKVSITPGATVVMGGLITEQRKAMDDKVPFLGDLPFVGRLFRSHAEQTIKRNLLIFVTGRLITPSGREISLGQEKNGAEDVTPAPKAE